MTEDASPPGGEDPKDGDEREAPRHQPLLEGPVGSSKWRYRTARIPGYVDFFEETDEDVEAQSVEVGGVIREVRPLRDTDDRQVLVITDRKETVVRRDVAGRWQIEGTRPRSSS